MAWIKLHKELLDSHCFANPISLKIWIWLLMKANYKKSFSYVAIGNGGVTVEVDRGQLIFGRFKAEEELNIDGSTIYKQLLKMEKLEQIKLEPTNYYTLVTVLKFNDYQHINETTSLVTTAEQQCNNSGTTAEQQCNTLIDVLEVIEYKDINISFLEFWNLYDKKVGEKNKLQKKWQNLKDDERVKAMQHIPKYKLSQPEKKYRKDPSTYLNNKSFNDEIIGSNVTQAKEVPDDGLGMVAPEYRHLGKTAYELSQMAARGEIDF